jgi:hypothetical protein
MLCVVDRDDLFANVKKESIGILLQVPFGYLQVSRLAVNVSRWVTSRLGEKTEG